MKLKAITSRRELRDYEDLRAIEELGGRRIEEGIALAIARYSIQSEAGVMSLVTALADVDKCPEDDLVETPCEELIAYWHTRLPDVVASVSRYAVPALPPDAALDAVRRAGRDAQPIEEPRGKTTPAPRTNEGTSHELV